MFKPFTHFLLEGDQTYEFKIKIACQDMDSDAQDRLEHALKAYDLGSVSKPKRLPPDAQKNEFPHAEGCDVFLMTASVKLPCTDAQLRQVISDQGRFQLASVKVLPANQTDEEAVAELEADGKKEALLTKDLEKGEDGQPQVGQKRLDSMLKELESQKMEFAAKEKTNSKSTNDLPQNNKSPVAAKGKK
jgi:hypothetical protein